MAKAIKQFRYFANLSGVDNTSKNQPSLDSDKLQELFVNGALFDGSAPEQPQSYLPFLQIGIQTMPGVKFYLNEAKEPIMIGSTGIFELDLNGVSEITSLKFDSNSMNLINSSTNGHLIVDVVWESEEE